MDPQDFIQQCAQEDQASLHDYVTSSATIASGESSISLDDDVLSGGSRPGSSRPFNVSTHLIWNCAAPDCSKINDLTLCPTCKAVQYCSRKHLYADRPNHRSACAKIKKAAASLDHYLSNPERNALWINAHPDSVALRQILVENLLKMNTAQAVTMALRHLWLMLRDLPGDRIGVRDVVPVLSIRLGHDPEAYKYCSWWADTDTDTKEINAMDINVDVSEGVEAFTGAQFHLSHAVAVTLIKLRLLIDLQSLQRARTIAGPYVPRELLDVIQKHSTLSTITHEDKFNDCEDYAPVIEKLRGQITTMFEAVHKGNRHFWPALVEPGDNLQARPIAWKQGDEKQMQVALQHNYNAWSETPGAIDAIAGLLEGVEMVS